MQNFDVVTAQSGPRYGLYLFLLVKPCPNLTCVVVGQYQFHDCCSGLAPIQVPWLLFLCLSAQPRPMYAAVGQCPSRFHAFCCVAAPIQNEYFTYTVVSVGYYL